MTWAPVVPKMGRRTKEGDVVTIAPNRSKNRVSPKVRVSFARPLAASMGWTSGTTLAVEHDPERGMVRFRKATRMETGFVLFIPNEKNGGMARLTIHVPGQPIGDKETTMTVHHEVDGEYVVVRLPEWLIQPIRVQPRVRAV